MLCWVFFSGKKKVSRRGVARFHCPMGQMGEVLVGYCSLCCVCVLFFLGGEEGLGRARERGVVPLRGASVPPIVPRGNWDKQMSGGGAVWGRSDRATAGF